MLSEALFIPFLDNGNTYFSTIYNIPSTEAGTFLVLPYVFCALLCPFLGLLVDRIKWRSVVIIFSCLMFVLTYGGMMFLEYQEDLPKALIALPLILLGRLIANLRYLLRSILYSYSALSAHGRRAQAFRYGLRTDGDAAKPSTSLFPDLRVNDPEHCPHNREKIRL